MEYKYPSRRPEYYREWYLKNRDKRLAYNKKWRNKNTQAYEAFKKGLRCAQCGEQHVATLDFHHLDATTKDTKVSNMRDWSPKRMRQEADKCTVLCANCHRKLHYNQRLAS